MTGEQSSDSGNGEADTRGDTTVQGTFLTVHEILKDSSVAWQYPASGEHSATISLVHAPDGPYMFVERFDDDTTPPNICEANVEDGTVLFNAKKGLTDAQFEKYGPETAEKYMRWQDFSGLMVTEEEGQLNISRYLGDFLQAMQDGTLTSMDLSAVGAES